MEIRISEGNSSNQYPYFVKGKKYRFSMHKVIPIGTKVKIKYNPRNPQRFKLVNPHEFDNYPDEMKVQN